MDRCDEVYELKLIPGERWERFVLDELENKKTIDAMRVFEEENFLRRVRSIENAMSHWVY